jgi:hypothetical protein
MSMNPSQAAVKSSGETLRDKTAQQIYTMRKCKFLVDSLFQGGASSCESGLEPVPRS